MKEEADELESLMRRYQQSDREAASRLVESLSAQVFRFFLAQVRDRSRAEDLLQDFWLRVHHARRTYRAGEPVLPWIYAIARRTQIDDFRRRTRVSRHEWQSETLPETAASAADQDDSPALDDLLKPLPASQREVLILLKVNGLSLEETARATGTSVGAVKQKAHRAYNTLRKVLGGS
ncbi:MAG TPA: RNA polymerase sigma factor [Bryobacteraceae bacterium]|jgi:RNA polymerase sigma-70 factor (ECF subfamily)